MGEITKKQDVKKLAINQETLDIIVANIIPTSKYFEVRFDHLEGRVDRIQGDIKDFRSDVDKRFEDLKSDTKQHFDDLKSDTNQRFDDLKSDTNQRFDDLKSDTNQRFDDLKSDTNQRLEQVIASIDRLSDKLDNRDRDHRSFTLRMFSISIMISFLGVLGLFLKMFKIV